ncbi:unnamed protein product, partial [Mesorhabditis belari]|uniref:Carbonic anhydrase n=1 Tax=Mesorhabditis belari TaxID=2138241 RepID=A0AAF3F720_9BILA
MWSRVRTNLWTTRKAMSEDLPDLAHIARCSAQESPIEISHQNSSFKHLGGLSLHYHRNIGPNVQIAANGHGGFNVYPANEDFNFLFYKRTPFHLAQMHAHWGSPDQNGSEHVIDGIQYPMELHFVHYNKKKYSTFSGSIGQPGGIAVIAVLVQIGENNVEFEKISKLLVVHRRKRDTNSEKDGKANGSGETFQLPTIITNMINGINEKLEKLFDFRKLLPDSLDYFAYEGSLTTANYEKCVQWIVLRNSITISKEQIDTLHGVSAANFRRLQPLLGETKVERNFREMKIFFLLIALVPMLTMVEAGWHSLGAYEAKSPGSYVHRYEPNRKKRNPQLRRENVNGTVVPLNAKKKELISAQGHRTALKQPAT